MKMVTLTIAAVMLLAVWSFRPISKDAFNSGLYLTPDDFKHNKLSFGETTRIKIHEGLFGSSTVDLIYQGKKEVFSFSKVYGYRDKKGQSYRFFDGQSYKIIDTAGFYLYSCVRMVMGEKIARPTMLYFFSVEPEGMVKALTLNNLADAYPKDTRFLVGVETLEGPLHSEAELAAYDGLVKEYKIKMIYRQSHQ